MRCNLEIPQIQQVDLRWQGQSGLFAPKVVQAIHMLATSENVRVCYGYCDKHRPWISARAISTIFGLLGALMLLMGLGTMFMPGKPYPKIIYYLLGSIVPFTIAIIAAVWPWEARVKKKGTRHAWVTGFGKAYLDDLPDYEHDGEAVETQF